MNTIPNRSRRRHLSRALLLAGAALCGLPSATAAEAGFPMRPVRIVLGHQPGGSTDMLVRIIGPKMSEALGQPVVIENRSGANSNIAATLVARSAPDGYTVFGFTLANAINPSLYKNITYDPPKDFQLVGMIAKLPNILVVNKNLPVKTVADYARLVKEAPNGVSFASSGAGSTTQLCGEIFRIATGGKMLHVPYKGSGPAMTDLIGGNVDSMFDNSPSAMPFVKSGRIRPLAVTSPKRMPQLPDVPTLAESGYPELVVESWFALAVPAKTPKPVVEKLNAALNSALKSPEVVARLADLLATPDPVSADESQAFMVAETARWREVVQKTGARIE